MIDVSTNCCKKDPSLVKIIEISFQLVVYILLIIFKSVLIRFHPSFILIMPLIAKMSCQWQSLR